MPPSIGKPGFGGPVGKGGGLCPNIVELISTKQKLNKYLLNLLLIWG